MSDDKPKKKRLDAFYTKEGRDGKSFFTKVGAAFQHKSGEGFNLKLDAQTPSGEYVLLTPKERIKNMQSGEKASYDQEHDR